MAKISKNVVILSVAAICIAFWAVSAYAESEKTEPAQKEVNIRRPQKKEQLSSEKTEPAQKEVDPYEGTKILVEAFVVEVKLDALYKSGVSPIGQKPHSVSISDILKCLKDKNAGTVTSGTKLAVKQDGKGEIRTDEAKNLEQKTTFQNPQGGKASESISFLKCNSDVEFRANVHVNNNKKIEIDFKFEQALFLMPEEHAAVTPPPDKVTRNWQNTVSLKGGEPTIVGEIQNEDKAVFLILCADIE
jgi:hypothetical protein